MKIPKYIREHVKTNNKLLVQTDKYAQIVLEWYDKQLEKLNADAFQIPDEEFNEIQYNWMNNGNIDISAIKENLELLEQE